MLASDRIAAVVADRLFKSPVAGRKADRLVVQSVDRKELGGWCREAVEDVVADVLNELEEMPISHRPKK